MPVEIRDRSKKFAIEIIKSLNKPFSSIAANEIARQLIRSSCSIGANLEEADASPTKKDFIHKVTISYKEARESRYWLELLLEADVVCNKSNRDVLKILLSEAEQLSKILYTIIKRAKE